LVFIIRILIADFGLLELSLYQFWSNK